MNKTLKKTVSITIAGAAVIFLFLSCTDFFTSSWAVNAKRDPANMKVDASNVFKLLKAARGDSDLSMEILDKIAGQIDGASASDKAKLREAALVAAAQATDVAGMVVSSIDKLTSAGSDSDIQGLLDSIIGGADMGKLAHASGDLVKILPDVDNNGIFTADFKATESELLQAAFIIILGESGGNVDAYLAGWDGSTKKLDNVGSLPPEEKALAGIVNKLVKDYPNNELSKQISDLLSSS